MLHIYKIPMTVTYAIALTFPLRRELSTLAAHAQSQAPNTGVPPSACG